MTKDATPWSRGLLVTVPDYPDVETSRDATTAKLARNLAALFGVEVPRAGVRDAPWLCGYNELSIVDIGRGSPPGWEPLDGMKIASGTLSKFGPEVKSAIVLTGANKLFDSLTGSMTEVLKITHLADDGQPLADASRICIWASLQLDAFEAQPALAMAAYQARAIQRAASVRWTPLVDAPAQQSPHPKKTRTIEFDSTPVPPYTTNDGETRADQFSLNIVDHLMEQVVAPVAVNTADGEMSNSLLVEETINRLLSHIANAVADTGFARISADSRGRRHIDVVVNRTSLLGAYLDANLRLFNDILPYAAPRNHGSEQLDLDEKSHWQRLVPRVPSKFEMLLSSPTVQSATLRSLANLIHALRSMQATLPDDISIECRKRALGLVRLATELFGEDHEETLTVRCLYGDMLFTALRRGSAEDFDQYRDLRSLSRQTIRDCLRLFKTADTWPAGEWLQCLDRLSPTLSVAILNLRGIDDEADRAAGEQIAAWSHAFDRLGVDVAGGKLETLHARSNGLASPLHHWMSEATRVDQPFELVQRAIDVGLKVVLPHRQRLAAIRKHDRPLRQTLHVLGRAISDAFDRWTDTDTRDLYARKLLDIEDQLVRTSRVTFLLGIDLTAPDAADKVEPLVTSDADLMMSLAAIVLRNLELSPSETDPGRLDRALAMARAIQTARLGKLVDSDMSRRLRGLEQRKDELRTTHRERIGGVAPRHERAVQLAL